MKADCGVGDLIVLWHLFQEAFCSAKVTCNGEYEKFEGVNFTI